MIHDKKYNARFAPSPSGFLHPGNIRSALMNYLYINNSGNFILRIDDTNEKTATQESVASIKNDLAWLEIKYSSLAHQSDRKEIYREIFDLLLKNDKIYRCYDNEEEHGNNSSNRIRRSDFNPSDHNLDQSTAFYRFELPNQKITWNDMIRGHEEHDLQKMSSDPVVFRRDGSITYLLASAIDDVTMNITHIIRGEDHVANTAIQIAMINAISDVLSLSQDQIIFAHLPLLSFEGREKLSKRNNSLSIQSMRENGILPMAINSYIMSLGGDFVLSFANVQDLLNEFSRNKLEAYFSSMGRSSPEFSMKNLLIINKKLTSHLSYKEMQRYAELANISAEKITEEMWLVIRENLENLKMIENWNDIFFSECIYCDRLSSIPNKDVYFQHAKEYLPSENPITEESFNKWINAIKVKTGLSRVALYMPLRLALTGMEHGPKMSQILQFLSHDIIQKRINIYSRK